MAQLGVVGLLADAHHAALCRLASLTGDDFTGLAVAARVCRRKQVISTTKTRKLERVDVAMHVVRHLTAQRVTSFLSDLDHELQVNRAMRYPNSRMGKRCKGRIPYLPTLKQPGNSLWSPSA